MAEGEARKNRSCGYDECTRDLVMERVAEAVTLGRELRSPRKALRAVLSGRPTEQVMQAS